MPRALAAAVVFVASAAVLVTEILAGRLLAPFVGVTLETYTAVIGVVLAGIALGSFLGGRLADRVAPARLLGPQLVLGGALTCVTVPLVTYVGAGLASSGAVGRGAVLTIVLTVLGFLAPATVLSAVTPTVVKLQLGSLEETGSVVGRLSAVGTSGALVGTFVTGFVLVAAFPTRPVLLAVGAVLAALGVGLQAYLKPSEPRSVASYLVVGVLAAGFTWATPSLCQQESAYFCIQVRDLPPCEGQTLYLDTLRHSCVYPDDPLRLDFTYAQTMADVIAALPPGPLETLHIGGGGFTLPRYVNAARPGSTSLVLEIDPALVTVAEQELGLVIDEDLRVEVGDARTRLAEEPDAAYDLVIGDAFGGLAVPWHLTTRELLADVRRVLRPDGVYTLNMIDNGDLGFARAEAATLADVFAHVAVLAPPERLAGEEGGNFVMVASDAPLSLAEVLARNAGRGDDEAAVSTGDGLEAFVGAADVLTDDHAPVDQLLTPQQS